MPSVLSVTIHHDSKAYAPLADEVNPPFGNMAPSPQVTRNGTIVYSKRQSSSTSETSNGSDDLQRVGAPLRNDSEETLSATSSSKGKGRSTDERRWTEDTGDIGEVRRAGYKGKERAWDVERGDVELIEEEESAGAQYPPLSEAEEEERRIQNNLAKFAAKDAARRRAARESRMMQGAPTPSSPSSSTTSYARRPFSLVSTTSKRSSIMGLMEGIWPSTPKKAEAWQDGELPTVHSPHPGDTPYNNPYDTQPSFSPAPKMSQSPTSPSRPSPFADPLAPAPVAGSSSSQRRPSLISSITGGIAQSPLVSPTDEAGFAYGGPTWRGGQASRAQEGDAPPQGGEKWWHALCAWGTDLDGGHEGNGRGNQAGRTNPFE
ncbi:hypothetical protein IAU60_002239 [Kwoniella sp. DSM 27419]